MVFTKNGKQVGKISFDKKPKVPKKRARPDSDEGDWHEPKPVPKQASKQAPKRLIKQKAK
jgi:hypothetical protein